MSRRFACPHCDAGLQLTNAPPPGKKIRCPRCDSVFPYRADALQSEAPARTPLAGVVVLVAVLGGVVLAGGAVAALLWKKYTAAVAEGESPWQPPASGPAASEPGKPPRPWQPPPGWKPPVPPPGLVRPGGLRPPAGRPPEPPPGDPSKAGIAVGNTAQEIEGEDQDGKRFKLSDYRGKVVLLDFWSQF
jgi:hypothetical protein